MHCLVHGLGPGFSQVGSQAVPHRKNVSFSGHLLVSLVQVEISTHFPSELRTNPFLQSHAFSIHWADRHTFGVYPHCVSQWSWHATISSLAPHVLLAAVAAAIKQAIMTKVLITERKVMQQSDVFFWNDSIYCSRTLNHAEDSSLSKPPFCLPET